MGHNLAESARINLASTTFLCGNPTTGSACKACHPSCQSCDLEAGICDACMAGAAAAKIADGAACVCKAGTGTNYPNLYHATCLPCHASCSTCGYYSNVYWCRTCAAFGATLPIYSALGTCECRTGYVAAVSPTTACTPICSPGCSNCIGPHVSECMSIEQANFVKYVATAYSLPLLTESASHHFCYFEPKPIVECTPDPIETVVGPITDYETVARPTKYQCYNLLTAQWPFLTHWFNSFFPGFVGPQGATENELLKIKSVVYLWILRFGPSEINSWTTIKNMIKASGSAWANYMAWIETPPGVSVQPSLPPDDFPADLLDWLTTSCSGVTVGCKDLDVFNLKSTVCDSACTAPTKGYCAHVKPGSVCAAS